MKPADEEYLRTSLRGLKTFYPSLDPEGKGILRAFIGFSDFHGLTFPEDFAWNAVEASDWPVPTRLHDPLAALMGTKLFLTDDGLNGGNPQIQTLGELQKARYLPTAYAELRKICLQKNDALLRKCGRPVDDSTVQRRSFCYRLILTADRWDEPDRLAAAQETVENRRKGEKVRGEGRVHWEFSENWDEPTIEDRESIELRQLQRDVKKLQAAFRRERRDVRQAAQGTYRSRTKRRAERRRRDSALLPSSYPLANDLCRQDVKTIILGAVAGCHRPEYLVLAIAVATLSNPSTLLHPDLKMPSSFEGMLLERRETKALHRGPKFQPEDYIPTSPGIPVFWPKALTDRFALLKAGSLLPTREQVDVALRHLCLRATWPKLLRTLARHGSIWFDLPYLWLQTAARPKGKPIAPSHYSRLGRSLTNLTTYLRMFDPQFDLTPEIAEKVAFGSRRVLRSELVQYWATQWLQLCRNSLPNKLSEALIVWNLIASGAYDMCRFLHGLREGPVPSPNRWQLKEARPITVLKQKRLVLYSTTSIMKSFCILLETRHQELRDLAKSEGVSISAGKCSEAVFCHYRIGGRLGARVLKAETCSHIKAQESYLKEPSFARFALWWPNWPRHYSNTHLRAMEISELSVQRFHRHAPPSLDLMLWNQIEPPINFELHEELAKRLCSLIFVQ